MTETTLLSAGDIGRIIDENAARICDEVKDLGRFAIVGIQTRGVELANRIRSKIEALSGGKIDSGIEALNVSGPISVTIKRIE